MEDDQTDLLLDTVTDDAQLMILLGQTIEDDRVGLGNLKDSFFEKDTDDTAIFIE